MTGEIKSLKKQVAKERKNVNKLDLESERYDSVRAQIEENQALEAQKSEDERQKELWKCLQCGRGTLVIKKIGLPNGLHYFRSCDNPRCTHRTQMKQYNEKVKGVEDA